MKKIFTRTFTSMGLVGHEVIVEIDQSKALPKIEIIGLPDAAIKEAKERLRSTFKSCNVKLPARKFIINLAPSDIKKMGTRFDLPMAVALYSLLEKIDGAGLIEEACIFGELGLDGSIKKVTGLLPSVLSARAEGKRVFIIPRANLEELQYVPGIVLYDFAHFQELLSFLDTKERKKAIKGGSLNYQKLVMRGEGKTDFADIKGQERTKRALTIAAAGMHNVLMSGPPGSGKSLLAKATASILPPMSFEEVLEVSQIYSVVGELHSDQPLIVSRPFRAVHHTASKVSIVGGGQQLTPGEVSLAHLGVLFFDELPEFPRQVLEVLRQPLEDQQITISRAQGSVIYPANVMLIAAMNPCKCGFYKDREKQCQCSLYEIKTYQSKISGPLLDRFDMILEVPREQIEVILDSDVGSSSDDLGDQVKQAWLHQQDRYKDTSIRLNAHLSAKTIKQHITMQSEAEDFLISAVKKLSLSPRVMHRIIKLARSIADLEHDKLVGKSHIAEALQYRAKSLFVTN